MSSEYLLTDLLKSVSRSFYLSLRILPRPLRSPMSLGYLLARAADTIADTEIVEREKRIGHLLAFQAAIAQTADDSAPIIKIGSDLTGHQTNPAERILLEQLPHAIQLFRESSPADAAHLRFVLNGLITGMVKDLEDFPGNSPDELHWFETLEDFDQYTYHAAGIVGEFWTALCTEHLSSFAHWDETKMNELGIRFGKGLQIVNILKDTSADLQNGRCYYPAILLANCGLAPADLLRPESENPFRNVEDHLIQIALDHFEAAGEYIAAIPRREISLRLACIWPLWIGLKTLSLIARQRAILSSTSQVKITRPEVNVLICQSFGAVSSNSLVDGYTKRLMYEVKTNLHGSH